MKRKYFISYAYGKNHRNGYGHCQVVLDKKISIDDIAEVEESLKKDNEIDYSIILNVTRLWR